MKFFRENRRLIVAIIVVAFLLWTIVPVLFTIFSQGV